MNNFLSLDLGTTTVTGVAWDVEGGRVVRLAQRRNDAAFDSSLPTRAEQDPRRLRALALEVLAELAGRGKPVGGIALTGQKHGLLCVDDEGTPLTPLISWQDQRTAEPLSGDSTGLSEIDSTTLHQLHARLADLDWRENGCRIHHGYGAATWFWLVQQGELPARTRRVCTIADWLAGQLMGRQPQTDPTLAASWGLYSLVRDGWNVAFLDRLGLDTSLLPRVQTSGERLGGLSTPVAREVGLPGDIPVCNALGDTQASFLGGVADPERTVLFNLGTGGQICWIAPGFEPPAETVETRPLPHGRYLRVGASLCGGAAYAWLNHTVRAWLAEFGVHADEEAVYRRLNALAAGSHGREGLCVRTTFLGVRGDPSVGTRPDIRAGAIEGITLDNLRLGPLARATLLGIVDELRGLYEAHGGKAAEHVGVVASGGGVRKNPLLPGLIEERFGLPVRVPPERETAAVGAAMVAHRGPDASHSSP